MGKAGPEKEHEGNSPDPVTIKAEGGGTHEGSSESRSNQSVRRTFKQRKVTFLWIPWKQEREEEGVESEEFEGRREHRWRFTWALSILVLVVALIGIAWVKCGAVPDGAEGEQPSVSANEDDNEMVPAFRLAVTAVRGQSRVVFRMVNELARARQVEFAATQPVLREIDFAPMLDSDAIKAWNISLDAMQSYAGAVELLLGPERPQDVAESLRKAGEQLVATANLPLLRQDTVLSNAIRAIGPKLTVSAGKSSARGIMLESDSAVKGLTEAMAAMLYDNSAARDEDGLEFHAESGVVITVANSWDDSLARMEIRMLDARPDEKDGLARQYAEMVSAKETAIDAVNTLRQAILELAVLHSAITQRRDSGLQLAKTAVASAAKEIYGIEAKLGELRPASSQDDSRLQSVYEIIESARRDLRAADEKIAGIEAGRKKRR